MIRRKAEAFFFMFFLMGLLFIAAAQEDDFNEEEQEPPFDSEWTFVTPPLYARGDKTFRISLGPVFPLVFFDAQGGTIENRINAAGGTGSLGFNYFLGSNLFVGGELGLMFIGTRGENMLFMVPMGGRIGYQFVLGRFEFPLSLMVGGVPQQYLELNYFGFFLKPEASVFWRFTPSWSFGLNTSWWFVPQWSSHTVFGNFIELTLSARYHF